MTAALFVLTLGFAAPGAAHPHVWIDLRSTVVLDDNGRVTAIEEHWTFDEFYTVFATEGMDRLEITPQEALKEIARTNLKNLREYDYFTDVRAGGSNVDLGTVETFETGVQEGRMWMRFAVPLATPVDPSAERLSFSVYDPTYYIEILHLKGDVVSFRGSQADGCSGLIVAPKPTAIIITARSLAPLRAIPCHSVSEITSSARNVSPKISAILPLWIFSSLIPAAFCQALENSTPYQIAPTRKNASAPSNTANQLISAISHPPHVSRCAGS